MFSNFHVPVLSISFPCCLSQSHVPMLSFHVLWASFPCPQATLRVVQLGERSGRRVDELEAELERLRSRQGAMHRTLKRHSETKTKLEVTVHF